MKSVRRLVNNKRGIDTILAALLMVVIVVVASVMVYAWSTGLLGGLLVTPTTGKEALSLENTAWSTNSNVTLYLRNVGSATINLVSYYVKDASGNQYSRLTWTGPTMAPNALGATIIVISTACGSSCTGGATFTFSSGSAYTFTVVTSRNNQFVFTATR